MKNKIHYILIPLIVLFVSLAGSLFTSGGMDWYQSINLPDWTPDGSLIGGAWTTIFILAAISIIIFWNNRHGFENKNLIVWFFVINGALNILWSILFFGQHLIGAALIDAVLLGLSVFLLIIYLYRKLKLASFLLFPYFLWVCFASYLNFIIYTIN